MKQCKCGSWAINLHLHGRDGSDDDLCDVCYWSTRAERLTRELAELKADRDSWIEQASQRAQETVEAMQQVEAYRLRCEALHSAPREPLTDEQCDSIYSALHEWAQECDRHELGLPMFGDEKTRGREVIRRASERAHNIGADAGDACGEAGASQP